jgi:EmrB/QacA subfamily drug resistance transporter
MPTNTIRTTSGSVGSTPTSTPATSAAQSPRSHGRVLLVVCLSLATVVSAVASLNVALPEIARDTHATQTQLSWIVDAYALVFAALLLPAGAIGDRYGRRRALIAGLSVFGAASLAAMMVSDANALIALRGLLGVGAALVMPATLSTITATFPPQRRPQAISVWAGVAGASAILGLLTSGTLLEFWSWQSVFALNVVLVVVALIGTVRVVPESADNNAARLDVVGATIAAAGLAVLVYALIEAPEAGWLAARTLVGIVAGLVIIALFAVWELRRRQPLLDPRLFRNRRFAAGMLSLTSQFFAFFGFIFVILQFLQLVRGDSSLVAALCLLPMVACMIPSARLAAKLVGRFGVMRVCVTGLVIAAAGFTILAQLDADSSYWMIAAGLIPLGAGAGTAMTPATTSITEALPASEQGVASAMNDLARELGGAIGIAVLGSLLNATYREHLAPYLSGLPAPVADRARDSLALAERIGGSIGAHAQSAFVDGMHVALLCGAAVIAAAAIGVVLLLRRDRSPRGWSTGHSRGSARAIDCDREGRTDLSHPGGGQSAKPVDEHRDRDAFDRVEIDRRS